MAGRGAPPKPAGARKRRNKTPDETPIDTEQHPRSRRKVPAGTWHNKARGEWTTWAQSPQSARFLATDWDVLKEMLAWYDVFWRAHDAGDASTMSTAQREIRLNGEKLGRTAKDRISLRWPTRKDQPSSPAAEAKKAAKTTKRARRGDGRGALTVLEGGKAG